jgi:hypothetical protein
MTCGSRRPTADEPLEAWAKVLDQVARQLDGLPETEQEHWRKAMQYLYLLIRHKRAAEEQDDLFEVMDEAVTPHLLEMGEVKMTGAQALMEQGRKQGRQEGRIEGLREMLVRLLNGKFGKLPSETTAKVQALTEPQLDWAIERILTAETVGEMNL